MAAFVRFSIPHRYIGASTDTKPATAEVGSLCYEHDTGKTFVTYNGADWTEYAPTAYLNDVSAETLTLSGGAGALTFSAAATIVAASGLTMPAFTLGGAVTGNAQTISNANVTVGASRTLDVSAGTLTLAADQISGDKVEGGTINAITVNTLTLGTGLVGAAGATIASGAVNGNTLLLRANDTTFLTLTTGATDTLDIGAHNISGDSTVTATKLLTFGNVGTTICDTYIQMSNGSGTAGPKLKYSTATAVVLRNAADNAYADLYAGTIRPYGTTLALYFPTSAAEIAAKDTDDGYVMGKTRDTSVGLVEIFRMVGAADPYFRVGRDDAGVALNAVTDGLYLQMAGGTGNSASGQGFGMPFLLGNAASETEERASIDCVLVTATNGAEDARFDFNVQAAGAAPATILSLLGKSAYMGTSGAPIALTVGTPTFSLYSTCADLGTGNAEPFYVKNTLTGAGAYGGRSRFDLVVNAAAGNYVNALKAYTSFGASGRVTGLASGFCAELALSAGTTQGTYAALEAELVAGAGAAAGTATSFLYCNATGDGAAVINGANGFLFELGAGVTDTEGGIFEAEVNNDSMSMTHVFKCRVAGVTYYIPLNTSKAF
jgi:hypothetical protein